jgi:hypothetical protein
MKIAEYGEARRPPVPHGDTLARMFIPSHAGVIGREAMGCMEPAVRAE